MNREFLPKPSLGSPSACCWLSSPYCDDPAAESSGVLRRAGMIGLLVYALIAAAALVRQGMTWIGLLFLLVLPGVAAFAALAGRLTAGRRADRRLDPSPHRRCGPTAAMLIAAGQTLSMVGIVDPGHRHVR
ncbi:MAG: hypothetical protein IPG68_16105 [Micrococcales bacterium]|nr:hypothetical protein [Micrococcales bacterium]